MTIVPIWSKSSPRTMRYLGDIYTGQNGTGRYVPNVDDIVYDWAQGFFRVITVDESSALSELIPWDDPVKPVGVQPEDILLGVGPGYLGETYRLMVNNEVLPRRMHFDGRLHCWAVDAAYVVVYLGTNITQNPIAVSAYYDENMNYISEKIPLVLAETNDTENYTKKVPVPGYCNRNLVSGMPVTVVTFNASGMQLQIEVLLVRDTAFLPNPDVGQRRITNISVDTPYLSATEENTINIPQQTAIESLGLRGIIHYNTGQQLAPLGSGKFKLDGLTSFVASYAGTRHPLTLRYVLGEGEQAEDVNLLPNGAAQITKQWWARIIDAPGGINVKLQPIPRWDATNLRWTLDYYLYSLDRDAYYYVPSNVIELGVNSPAFDPSNYTMVQHLTVAVDLDKISPSLPRHRHVQSFDISLRAAGASQGIDTRWYLYAVPYDVSSEYGANLYCAATRVSSELWNLDITSGIATVAEWLERVFYATKPLFDSKTESRAPTPTHFVINVAGYTAEFPIADWNTQIPVPNVGNESSAMTIHFISRVGSNDLELGVSPLRVVRYI